jgi:hypothetical protein
MRQAAANALGIAVNGDGWGRPINGKIAKNMPPGETRGCVKRLR